MTSQRDRFSCAELHRTGQHAPASCVSCTRGGVRWYHAGVAETSILLSHALFQCFERHEEMPSQLNHGDFSGFQALFKKLAASFSVGLVLPQNSVVLVSKCYRW